MRTLVVFHLGGVGGPQRSLVQASGWLGEQGEVEFLVPEPGAAQTLYEPFGRVSVLPYATPAGREIGPFRRELESRRPDLVIAVTTVLPALLVAARLARVPVVVYAAELHERRLGRLLVAFTALLADGLVCASQQVADQFPSWFRRPMAVALPPIGAEYEAGNGERARARYGVDGASPCLVVAGSISRGRGQDVALRALALVRERFPAARLVIAGAPHSRAADLAFAEELRALAAELEQSDAVVFAEPTDAMADLYAAADIVLNPVTVAESFGRVGAEALRAGPPVVASRTGAIPEVIRDGVDALLVEPGDPHALAAAVGQLMDDPAGAARLVESGRRRVREQFGHEQDLAAWRSVIEAVLAYGPRRWRADRS